MTQAAAEPCAWKREALEELTRAAALGVDGAVYAYLGRTSPLPDGPHKRALLRLAVLLLGEVSDPAVSTGPRIHRAIVEVVRALDFHGRWAGVEQLVSIADVRLPDPAILDVLRVLAQAGRALAVDDISAGVHGVKGTAHGRVREQRLVRQAEALGLVRRPHGKAPAGITPGGLAVLLRYRPALEARIAGSY